MRFAQFFVFKSLVWAVLGGCFLGFIETNNQIMNDGTLIKLSVELTGGTLAQLRALAEVEHEPIEVIVSKLLERHVSGGAALLDLPEGQRLAK